MSEQTEFQDDLSRLAWTEPSLPHGAGMRWISLAALGADKRTGYAQARFSGSHPFVRGGALLRPAIIELLAQAAAAVVSLQTANGHTMQVKEGMLVAMKDLVVVRPVPIDEEILLCVRLEKTFGTFTSARLEARYSSGGDESCLAHASMTFFIKTES
jgi:predicted hotdog family 3-hydroxylacyl-ACP dehydratase